MGIKGEEVHDKGIRNISNPIIAESLPNLEKSCPFSYRKPGYKTDLTKIEPLYGILSLIQLAQRTKDIEVCKKENTSNI
jgi:hypothetical protein